MVDLGKVSKLIGDGSAHIVEQSYPVRTIVALRVLLEESSR